MIVKGHMNEDTLFIDLIGELDHHSAAAAREQLDELVAANNCRRVILDMRYMPFMDSSGIGILIGRYKKLTSHGTPLYITNPAPIVDRILMMSGIYRIVRKL